MAQWLEVMSGSASISGSIPRWISNDDIILIILLLFHDHFTVHALQFPSKASIALKYMSQINVRILLLEPMIF